MCPADRSRSECLDALLGHVAHGLHVRVALLGGSVGGAHHATRGADERQAGHTVHHAGLEGRGALGEKLGTLTDPLSF